MELSLTLVCDGLRHYRCRAFGFCYLREFNKRGSMIPSVEQRHLKDTTSIPPRRIDMEHWWNGVLTYIKSDEANIESNFTNDFGGLHQVFFFVYKMVRTPFNNQFLLLPTTFINNWTSLQEVMTEKKLEYSKTNLSKATLSTTNLIGLAQDQNLASNKNLTTDRLSSGTVWRRMLFNTDVSPELLSD